MPSSIDPKNPSENDIKMLVALFEQVQPKNGWLKEVVYSIDFNEKKEEVSLKNTVLKRPSKKQGMRYEVLALKSKGEGTFAFLYPVDKTYRNEDGRLTHKTKFYGKKRIVKQFNSLTALKSQGIPLTANDIQREYRFIQKTPHLNPKGLIEIDQNYFIIMQRLEGRDLLTLLQNEGKRNFISIPFRFKLTRSILNAYLKEVEDINLVHRDLKPENIMVDRLRGVAHVVDYGFAKEVGETLKENLGSPGYISPEAILQEGVTTPKSDGYSLGRILALLWGFPYTSYALNAIQICNIIRVARENNYDALFTVDKERFKDLPEDVKKGIQLIIKAMTPFDPSDRLLPRKAVFDFEALEKSLPVPKLQLGGCIQSTPLSIASPLPSPAAEPTQEKSETPPTLGNITQKIPRIAIEKVTTQSDTSKEPGAPRRMRRDPTKQLVRQRGTFFTKKSNSTELVLTTRPKADLSIQRDVAPT